MSEAGELLTRNTIKTLLILLIITPLQACNTPPAKIVPIELASSAYLQRSCSDLERQLSRLDDIVSAQRSQLQSDANLDTGIVAGSLLLTPLGLIALAATGNGDLKYQYAKNLGKQKAIYEAIELGLCSK